MTYLSPSMETGDYRNLVLCLDFLLVLCSESHQAAKSSKKLLIPDLDLFAKCTNIVMKMLSRLENYIGNNLVPLEFFLRYWKFNREAILHRTFRYDFAKKPACLRFLHNVLKGVTDSPLCRACMKADETPTHVLLECEGVADQREQYLQSPASLREALDNLGGLLGFWRKLGWME